MNWDQVTGATGYRVLLVNGGQTSLLARVPAMSNGIPVTSAVLTGLHPLVNQTIRVEAYNAANKAVSDDVSFSMPSGGRRPDDHFGQAKPRFAADQCRSYLVRKRRRGRLPGLHHQWLAANARRHAG